MERPNINKFFEMAAGGSKEGYMDTHQTIKILTEFNMAWLQYELYLQERLLEEMKGAQLLRKKLGNIMDAILHGDVV